MDLQILYFILGISGAVITILLSVIGIFLKMILKTINSLEQTTNILAKSVAVQEANQMNSGIGCLKTHTVIDTRLNEHSRRLNEHDKDLARLNPGKK